MFLGVNNLFIIDFYNAQQQIYRQMFYTYNFEISHWVWFWYLIHNVVVKVSKKVVVIVVVHGGNM